VIQQRMDFQELMRERFSAVIESATGRQVVGFMSGNQQDPDIMCEVFVLTGTDLVEERPNARSRPPSSAEALDCTLTGSDVRVGGPPSVSSDRPPEQS
jgi:hypothetical protein